MLKSAEEEPSLLCWTQRATSSSRSTRKCALVAQDQAI